MSTDKKDFVWTDELAKEFSIYYKRDYGKRFPIEIALSNFKLMIEKSKEVTDTPVQQERIEVKHLSQHDYANNDARYKEHFWYQLQVTKPLWKLPNSEVMKKIEAILNNDTNQSKDDIPPQVRALSKGIYNDGLIHLSKEQLDKMMENVWMEARATHPLLGMKHKTFKDYLESLAENQPSTTPTSNADGAEQGWEILSYKQDSHIGDLWTKFSSGWCRNSNGVAVTAPYTDLGISSNSLYKIHSVKRLSDNQVFSVGDEVMWDLEQLPYKKSEKFTIANFQINELVEPYRIFINNLNICIDYIQKLNH